MTTLQTAIAVKQPDDLIAAAAKDYEWILQYLKWIWHDYDTCGQKKMFFANREKYQKIKAYAMGKQSIDIYKPMLNIDEQANETWMNIDFAVIPIYPKYRRIALRKLNKVDYNIVATPIDALADNEKNKAYAKIKAKIKAHQAFAEIGSPIADSPKLKPQANEPQDEKELDIKFQYSFKHNIAVEMENGIKLVFYQNDIKNIQVQVKEDALDLGTGIEKLYIDSNGAIKIRRVDPEKFIVNHCKKKDFSDKKYAGEVIEMTLGELKQLAQDQFSADQYKDIAGNIMGNFGNPGQEPANVEGLSSWYDSLKIWVLDAEFFSINQIAHEKVIDKRGNLLIGNAYVDKKGKLRGELIRSSYKVVYQGMWIIGTNYLFNYGLKTNMIRAKKSLGNTDLSFKIYVSDFYKMNATSVSEQVIPIIDQIQMDWYHLQNVKNQAVPKGISIELGSLEQITLGKGGTAFTKMEVIDLYKQTGVLAWRRMDAGGNGQELRPIEELQNGIGEDAKFYFDSMMANISLLKEIAGLNDFTDASNPNPRALTTIANMAYEGTDNALGHVLETNKFLLEKVATETMLALQDLVSMGADVSGYIRALGDNTMKFFKLSENVSNYEYGIMLEDKPTDEERNLFLQEAEKALNANQIKYSDLVYIRSIDNLKEAEMILGYKIDQWQEQQTKQSLALQQQNGQIQIQSAQAAEQARQKTLQIEYQLKTQHELALKEADQAIQREKYQFEMQLKKMDNETVVVSNLIQTDSKEYIAGQKPTQDTAHQDAAKILNED